MADLIPPIEFLWYDGRPVVQSTPSTSRWGIELRLGEPRAVVGADGIWADPHTFWFPLSGPSSLPIILSQVARLVRERLGQGWQVADANVVEMRQVQGLDAPYPDTRFSVYEQLRHLLADVWVEQMDELTN